MRIKYLGPARRWREIWNRLSEELGNLEHLRVRGMQSIQQRYSWDSMLQYDLKRSGIRVDRLKDNGKDNTALEAFCEVVRSRPQGIAKVEDFALAVATDASSEEENEEEDEDLCAVLKYFDE
jgi:hypothetical protein